MTHFNLPTSFLIRSELLTCIIRFASARSNKNLASCTQNDTHGVNIDPKIEKNQKKEKESKGIGQKKLKSGQERKYNNIGNTVF
jgi:hypothetical protein